jgi:hypothetical protein
MYQAWERSAYKVLVGNSEGKGLLRRPSIHRRIILRVEVPVPNWLSTMS